MTIRVGGNPEDNSASVHWDRQPGRKISRHVIQLTHVRSHSEISEATASVLASEHPRYGGCHGETKPFEQEPAKGRTRPPRPRRSPPARSDRTAVRAACCDAGFPAQHGSPSSRFPHRGQRAKGWPRRGSQSDSRLGCMRETDSAITPHFSFTIRSQPALAAAMVSAERLWCR
jgi:hypothetical protein